MPKQFSGLDVEVLYPDNWQLFEDAESGAVTFESPQGAFMTLTKLAAEQGPSLIEQAKAAMAAEYDAVEEEAVVKNLGPVAFSGITQRFVYLDLIITSHLLSVDARQSTYFVQIQGEDRDMEQLEQVFDALLTCVSRSLSS